MNLLPRGANSFLLEWTTFQKGLGVEESKQKVIKVVSLLRKVENQVYPAPINCIQLYNSCCHLFNAGVFFLFYRTDDPIFQDDNFLKFLKNRLSEYVFFLN